MKKSDDRKPRGKLGGVRPWKGSPQPTKDNSHALRGKMEWNGGNNNPPENRKQVEITTSFK